MPSVCHAFLAVFAKLSDLVWNSEDLVSLEKDDGVDNNLETGI